MRGMWLGTRVWVQAHGVHDIPTHGVLNMNSATQNMGKNTKYSKMQKMWQCGRRQLGRWVCASEDFMVCVHSGCNFGAGTNEMCTERGGSSKTLFQCSHSHRKLEFPLKSLFSPKVSGFYPQMMTIHKNKAERSKSSVIHEDKKLLIWEMLEGFLWE